MKTPGSNRAFFMFHTFAAQRQSVEPDRLSKVKRK